jgi:hypothetical protein
MIISIRRWLLQLLQRIAGVWYEGPTPPSRFARSIGAFEFSHPIATREQWATFALQLAEEGYRQGYQRGYEQRVDDLSEVLGEIVVPMTQHPAFKEQATPYRLETEAKIAESVPLRATSGKAVMLTLDDVMKPDPRLQAHEDEFWRNNAGIGPKR